MMLVVTDKASEELKKVLTSEMALNKYLILYFQGAGWSGPSLGMALDESTENMEKLESNGVTAYIDRALNEHLAGTGDINIDFIQMENGPSGYQIVVGEKKCGDGSCHCE